MHTGEWSALVAKRARFKPLCVNRIGMNMSIAQTDASGNKPEWRDFLRALYSGAPEELYFELRCIHPDDGDARSFWSKVGDKRTLTNALNRGNRHCNREGYGLYFAPCLRHRSRVKQKRQRCCLRCGSISTVTMMRRAEQKRWRSCTLSTRHLPRSSTVAAVCTPIGCLFEPIMLDEADAQTGSRHPARAVQRARRRSAVCEVGRFGHATAGECEYQT